MAWRSSADSNAELCRKMWQNGVIQTDIAAEVRARCARETKASVKCSVWGACMNRVQAFREVDRGFFAPKERQHEAYYDQPIKCGNLHMSEPHIYGTVIDALELSEGLSFLNIGAARASSTVVAYITGRRASTTASRFTPTSSRTRASGATPSASSTRPLRTRRRALPPPPPLAADADDECAMAVADEGDGTTRTMPTTAATAAPSQRPPRRRPARRASPARREARPSRPRRLGPVEIREGNCWSPCRRVPAA